MFTVRSGPTAAEPPATRPAGWAELVPERLVGRRALRAIRITPFPLISAQNATVFVAPSSTSCVHKHTAESRRSGRPGAGCGVWLLRCCECRVPRRAPPPKSCDRAHATKREATVHPALRVGHSLLRSRHRARRPSPSGPTGARLQMDPNPLPLLAGPHPLRRSPLHKSTTRTLRSPRLTACGPASGRELSSYKPCKRYSRPCALAWRLAPAHARW